MANLVKNATKKAFDKLNEDKLLDAYELIADRFNKIVPAYYDRNKNIFLYDKDLKKWVMADKTDIICMCKNLLGESNLNETKHRTAILNAIMDRARWNTPEEVPKKWIQFEDFFYDIETQEKIKVDKNYFSQIKIPHKIGETTNTPVIDQHIKSWVGDDQYKLFLQICAYCMYKDYPFSRFFIFYGTGQDGKSTAGEFISRLIGKDNSCTIDIDSLQSNRFEAQKLYQKTFAICGEVDYKLLKNTRKLKGVTGNDPITIEFKNKSPFMYNNFAKLLWYANGIPPTYDKTEGFYRRTIILKFPNKFKENPNPLGDISEQEYENFCLKCMDYLKDLLENCFDEKNIEDKKIEYEELSNPVLKFFRENMVESTDKNVLTITDIFKEYQKYAKKYAYRDLGYNEFLTIFSNIDDVEIKKKKIYFSLNNGQYYESTGHFEGNYERKLRTFINNYQILSDLSILSTKSAKIISLLSYREVSENRVDKLDKMDKIEDKMDKIEDKTILDCQKTILECAKTGQEFTKNLFLGDINEKNYLFALDKFKELGLIAEIKPEVYVGVLK